MMRGTLLIMLCVLGACTRPEANTQIVLSVDTDYAIPAELDAIHFKIEKRVGSGYDAPRLDRDEPLRDKGQRDFPLTLAMTSVASGKPTVRVTVTGRLGRSVVVERQAIVSFRTGQTLSLPMNLVRACRQKQCGEGLTCGDDGQCESVTRDELQTWPGTPPGLDASTAQPTTDAGPSDASAGVLDGASPGTDADTPEAGADGGDAGAPAPRISQLAVGFHHSCALLVSGRVACWGGNAMRELGFDTQETDCREQGTACSENAQLVEGVQNALEIGAGERFSCARTIGGEVSCWGTNSSGQLGSGDLGGSYSARRVRFRAAPAEPFTRLSGVDMLAVGRSQACARVASTHGLVCWGAEPNDRSQLPLAGSAGSSVAVQTDIKSGVEKLALGHSHGCFIDPDSALWCWGWNESAQIGLDPVGVSHTTVPHKVFASGVTEVAAGGAHTCAVVDGTVRCFGSAFAGQLGFGRLPDGLPECLYGRCTPQAFPVEDVISSRVLQLALADFASCARYKDGRVACWGSGYLSLVGQPDEAGALSPTYLLANPRRVRLLAGFASHFCLSVSDRPSEVLCWGANSEGQLGPSATIGMAQPELATISLDPAF